MNRIKELREKNNISQIKLAKIIHVSNQAISAYERGKRKPKIDKWQALANYFNVSIPYLQGIDEDIYDLKFPTKQEAIDFIHQIMKVQNIKLEDITDKSKR